MKKQGDTGSPCLIPMEDRKTLIFPPLTKMEIEEVERHDMMSLERPGGKIKKKRARLIKDYSSLLKAFSRLILRSILWVLPFNHLKCLR